MTTQSLSNIVNVTVQVSPLSVVNGGFNLGLIVGQSKIFPDNTRVMVYSGTDDMLSQGWQGTEPEYLAAELYFNQNPRPNAVAIGRWDPTNNVQVANPTVAPTLTTSPNGGSLPANTYYGVYTWANANGETQASPEASITTTGSTSTITFSIPSLPPGITGANLYLSTKSGSETKQGSTATATYTQSAALAAGTALPSSNTATAPETAVQAVTACRAANNNWYAVYVCDSVKADILAIDAYIESATPLSDYFYDTQDTDVLLGTTGNVMQTLQSNKAHRVFGLFSTTPYAGAAAMGYAMGANTGLANSAFTMAYKTLVGVTPEVLTTTQVDTILGYNGNVYTNYGATYDLLVQGTMADGTHFDEVLNLDVLTNDIQTAVMNALKNTPKVPQSEDGVNVLVNVITVPCANARKRGVLAPGIWDAAPVLNLQTGDTLSLGYMVLADTLANQSQSDRDARKSPPIYVPVKLAGAIEHAVIGVIVNR